MFVPRLRMLLLASVVVLFFCRFVTSKEIQQSQEITASAPDAVQTSPEKSNLPENAGQGQTAISPDAVQTSPEKSNLPGNADQGNQNVEVPQTNDIKPSVAAKAKHIKYGSDVEVQEQLSLLNEAAPLLHEAYEDALKGRKSYLFLRIFKFFYKSKVDLIANHFQNMYEEAAGIRNELEYHLKAESKHSRDLCDLEHTGAVRRIVKVRSFAVYDQYQKAVTNCPSYNRLQRNGVPVAFYKDDKVSSLVAGLAKGIV